MTADEVRILLFRFPFNLYRFTKQHDRPLIDRIGDEAHTVAHMENRVGIRHILIAVLVEQTADENRDVCQQRQVAHTDAVHLRVGQPEVHMHHLPLLAFLGLHLLFLLVQLDAEHPADEQQG